MAARLKFFKDVARAGVPFGASMAVVFGAQFGPRAGVPLGLSSGLLFGLALSAFGAYQRTAFSRMVPDWDGERVLKQGPANHFVRWEGVGGWLYLTDKRLLFRSHKLNAQTHELSIPLAEIVEARPGATAWVVPNGLRVVTTTGEERFVVQGRRLWAGEIQNVLTSKPETRNQ